MEQLTEQQAWDILKQHRPGGVDGLWARREELGWRFGWAGDYRNAPMGFRSWVVADNGAAGRLQLGETTTMGLRRLSNLPDAEPVVPVSEAS